MSMTAWTTEVVGPAKVTAGVTPDDLLADRPQLSETLVRWMIRTAFVSHHKTVLVGHAGSQPLIQGLGSMCGLNYWLVEPDPRALLWLMDLKALPWEDACGPENERFDVDLMWRMTVQEFAASFDPTVTQADVCILNSPPFSAAADLVDAYKFVKPHGRIVALLPMEDCREIKDWLAEKWADVELVAPQYYSRKQHGLQLHAVTMTRGHEEGSD